MLVPTSDTVPGEFDLGMRDALAKSVEYLCVVGEKVLRTSEFDISGGLAHIRGHRVGSGVFARYYDLVLALKDGRYAQARSLLRELLVLATETPEPAILRFGADALGEDAERFNRLLDLTSSGTRLFAEPSEVQWRTFEAQVVSAMTLIDQIDSALGMEIRGLIHGFVGAAPPAQNASRIFDSASSQMIWGSSFINVDHGISRIRIMECIIHEAAHQLLFAAARDTPLVTNPTHLRYASPLRRDPRPMDGVYHATFVCARLHYAYSRLRDNKDVVLDDEESETLDLSLRHGRRLFQQGYEVVERHGLLTDKGQRYIAAANDYMRSAA